MNLGLLAREGPSLAQGALVVIKIAAGHLTLGLIGGITLAIMQVYGGRFASSISDIIQKIFRSIPVLVLLIMAYFGLTRLVEMPAIIVAIIALGVRSMAYQSQVFRGGFKAVDPGQMESALSIGMTKLESIRFIILPQVLRKVIGPWSNIFNMEVKDISLAYAIGVLEILKRGRYIIRYTHGNSLLIYLSVALFYFLLARAGNTILYRLEALLRVPGFEGRGDS